MAQMQTESKESVGSTSVDYVVKPSDLLQVQVFQEPDLQREVRISQNSAIALPLIGDVSIAGLTVGQVQDKIQRLYNKDYLVNPQVSVIVLEYGKRTVNVLGAVNTPGAIPYPPNKQLTLLDAIALAGSFNRFADRREVRLSRKNADGTTESHVINADDLLKRGSRGIWLLKPNDNIFVPERIF